MLNRPILTHAKLGTTYITRIYHTKTSLSLNTEPQSLIVCAA